jgi:transcription initiation factor TFIIB
LVESAEHGEVKVELGQDLESCDSCGGRLLKDLERGQIVCESCGIVVDCPVLSPELDLSLSESSHCGRGYVTAVSSSGPPTTMAFHDFGVSAEIGGGFRDAKGKTLAGKARYRAVLLRRWHSRTRTKNSIDLNIAKALTTINELADRFGLPLYAREEACAIYRRIVKRRLTVGRSIQAFAVVSIYAAIRRAKLPLMLRDVLPMLDVSLPEFNAYLNVMKCKAGIRVPPPDPVAWIPKIASECGFSHQTQILAADYVRKMSSLGETFGMLPHVVATIALYRMGAVNGEKKDIATLAKTVKCAVTSIQKGLVSESAALRSQTKSNAVILKTETDLSGEVDPLQPQEGFANDFSHLLMVSNGSTKLKVW